MLIIIFACPAVCDGPGGETVSPVGTMLHNGEHWYGAGGGGDGDLGAGAEVPFTKSCCECINNEQFQDEKALINHKVYKSKIR